MAIQKTLLIGNGLNRTFKPETEPKFTFSPIAWNDALKKLSEYANLDIQNIDTKPLTLVFDEILLKSNGSDVSKLELQKYLAQLIGLSCNDALDSVFYTQTKHVLTTNYAMRHALNFDNKYLPFRNLDAVKENTFSLFRSLATQEGRRLWHINGDIGTPTSLTLGYRQYARYQAQIKNYLTAGTEYKKTKIKNSPLYRYIPNFDFETSGDPYSWVDVFLRDNIHVVGLSMDYTESILWWLLTEKMYLKQKYPKNIGGMTYHQINIKGKAPKGAEAEKLAMLSDLGVSIATYNADTHLDGYLDIAETMKKGSKARYQKALNK